MSSSVAEPTSKPTIPSRPSWWAPRVWLGSNFPAIMGLLARNHFRVGWRQWHIAATDLGAGVINSSLGLVQQAVYGRRIARMAVSDPIFIVGHWRTGTTLLHELLIQDRRHTYANTYACLAPSHFLVSQWLFGRMFRLLVPSHRPMDNMPLGLERPQEDEFGLCNLGLPSPYRTIAFPNEPPQDQDYYDLENVSPEGRRRWKAGFLSFVKAINCHRPGRLVLKSPPHTCRVKVLLELFPEARFVHLTRDPYVVFPSTVHLWKSLYLAEGLQTPTFAGLEELVFETYLRMHEQWERTRSSIDSNRVYSLKYEDLVHDPESQIKAIYGHLGLGDFEDARPAIERYLSGVRDYKTNKYRLTPEQEVEITLRWAPIIDGQGYRRSPRQTEAVSR